MKTAIIVALLLVATSAQLSVSPLFPIGAAVPDIVLIVLVTVTFFAGPQAGMLAIPFAALSLGLQSGREPGLLLIGYLPLLPITVWLAGIPVPLTGLGRFVIAGAGTGVLCRIVLMLGSMFHGATASVTTVIFQLITPGAILDVTLLCMAYAVCRSIRWEPREMTLQRRVTYR